MVAGAKEQERSGPIATNANGNVTSRSYVAKTLAWAGDSYAALAGNAGPADRRASDWRLALSYYRQSQEAWAKLTETELRPYRPDLKLTQQRIVECQNELAR